MKLWKKMGGVGAMGLACGLVQPPANAQDNASANAIDEIIVTARKREEFLQNVPIAVTALDSAALGKRGLDGPKDLVLSVPNVTFQRKQFRTNFQIRGIGSQLNAVGGDDGVGIHLNNAPLTANFVAEAEFFDVERVEVLRGPQGTLYGRNATGGVVNIITAKPKRDFAGEIIGEVGNFGSVKLQGFVNIPVGETFDVRLAGITLRRDGFTSNTLTGNDIDNRKIWSGRATVGFHPTEKVDAFLMWDHFRENDSRGARKTLCAKDVGLSIVGGVATGTAQNRFSAGCLPVSVYSDQSFGTPNTLATLPGRFGAMFGLQPRDSFSGKTVSRNLREAEVAGTPLFKISADIVEFNLEYRATDTVTLTTLTSYSDTDRYSQYDATGADPSVTFPASPRAPSGILRDGFFGTTDRLRTENAQAGSTKQWTQELRAQTNFDGPINLNIGGIYIDYSGTDYTLIASNILTALAPAISPTAYVDPLARPDFTGHNYFVNYTKFSLKSRAIFGEVYWTPSRDIKITGGLRYTDDKKKLNGSSTLLTPGRGPMLSQGQSANFDEVTGRINVAWSPSLNFTDKTLVYAGISRGYKGGGFNNPAVVAMGLSGTYDSETVNAFEVGTKNVLLDGSLVANATAFYYDYNGYQILRQVNRAGFNENIDANVKGLELETIWQPARNIKLNANIGYLDTNIRSGRVVDTFARTQNDPRYVMMNSTTGGCIYNTAGFGALLAKSYGQAITNSLNCGGPADVAARLAAAGVPAADIAGLNAGLFNYDSNVSVYSSGQGEGITQNLKGNQLPNAPHWTLSFGAEYSVQLGGAWDATFRGDYYFQSRSFARNNNQYFDRIKSWSNVNLSISAHNSDIGLTVRSFVKNLFNKDNISGFDILDESLGSIRQPVILDPRTFGISFGKSF